MFEIILKIWKRKIPIGFIYKKKILLNEVFNLLLWCYKKIYYGNEKIRTIVDWINIWNDGDIYTLNIILGILLFFTIIFRI